MKLIDYATLFLGETVVEDVVSPMTGRSHSQHLEGRRHQGRRHHGRPQRRNRATGT